MKQKIEDSQTIGGLDPAEDLWLWAYTGDSAIAENSDEVAATLSWAEDYGEVRLEDVLSLIHI